MEVRREVCHCEHCGNEAEMIITCSYVRVSDESEKKVKKEHRQCSICGNEADIIIEESE
ncbi:MAG: hypothetical protein ACP5TY_07595 [Thermodesulforhabdaceae bacterium]|jgi:hypothetical protein